MSKKRQSLGKGIEALLGEDALQSLQKDDPADIYNSPSTTASAATPQNQAEATTTSGRVSEIPLERIVPGPWQPRQRFDKEALEELAESIKSKGLLQPVLVCPFEDGYALIAGERRWRACQLAGISTIPALVREADHLDSGAMALIENIQRDDLDPLEVAKGMEDLQQHGLNHQEIASATGIARSSVTNILRLLALPEQVKQLLQEKQLEMGHARALLTLDPEQQIATAHTIVARGLSVRKAEQLVRRKKKPQAATATTTVEDPNITALVQRIGTSLAARVRIVQQAHGKGELRIGYDSNAQLNTMLERLVPEVMQEEATPSDKAVAKPIPVVHPAQSTDKPQAKPRMSEEKPIAQPEQKPVATEPATTTRPQAKPA